MQVQNCVELGQCCMLPISILFLRNFGMYPGISSAQNIKKYIFYITRGPFYELGLTSTPVWIHNHMLSKVWGDVT